METYYDSNELNINLEKTKILITGRNRITVNGQIKIKDEIVKNKLSIKLLGTLFSQDLKWNTNVTDGTNSLMWQM